jgi:hypothetical protein
MMNRKNFIRNSIGAVAALVVGNKLDIASLPVKSAGWMPYAEPVASLNTFYSKKGFLD